VVINLVKDGNITRLKTLLSQYRDHIITNKYTKLRETVGIVEVIEVVDTAISVLLGGL